MTDEDASAAEYLLDNSTFEGVELAAFAITLLALQVKRIVDLLEKAE